MRVLVDLLFIVPGKNRGTQTYVDSLLKELHLVEGVDIIGLTSGSNDRHYREKVGIKTKLAPVSGLSRVVRLSYQQAFVGKCVSEVGADILFCPGYLSPIWGDFKRVVTIHDMNFKDIPYSVPRVVKLLYELVLPRSTRRADRIIAVSGFSKGRINRWFPHTETYTDVIHEGPLAIDVGTGIECWENIKIKYGIRGRVVLSISSGAPHKNIENLLTGMHHFVTNYPSDACLVLIGHEPTPELLGLVTDFELEDRVVFTGFISNGEKVTFFKNSFVYAFPSKYEGFGLPILEAQCSRLPVICSRCGSLPEVAGDAALYFDADSPAELADALARLFEDEDLRRLQIERGVENVSRFSWKKAANETIGVLRNAINGC